jgi:hypothetical protein
MRQTASQWGNRSARLTVLFLRGSKGYAGFVDTGRTVPEPAMDLLTLGSPV